MDKKRLLLTGFEELGIFPTENQLGLFGAYLDELKRWNRAYSLTSLKTDREIIIKHFLDSSLYLACLGEDVRSIADVGSGAGFPGVPVKILRPDITVYLIEPSGKKAAFLRNIARRLGLENVNIIEKRVEDVHGLRVDAVLTRALFKAREFLGKCGHMVRKDGLLIMNKGPRIDEELRELSGEYEIRKMKLPHSGIKRNMLLIRVDPPE